MRFTFLHSHAFHRGRVSVDEQDRSAPQCLVEFSDGITVIAEWREDGEDMVLTVPSYRTAKGSQVAARTWRLRRGNDGEWRSQRAAG